MICFDVPAFRRFDVLGSSALRASVPPCLRAFVPRLCPPFSLGVTSAEIRIHLNPHYPANPAPIFARSRSFSPKKYSAPSPPHQSPARLLFSPFPSHSVPLFPIIFRQEKTESGCWGQLCVRSPSAVPNPTSAIPHPPSDIVCASLRLLGPLCGGEGGHPAEFPARRSSKSCKSCKSCPFPVEGGAYAENWMPMSWIAPSTWRQKATTPARARGGLPGEQIVTSTASPRAIDREASTPTPVGEKFRT